MIELLYNREYLNKLKLYTYLCFMKINKINKLNNKKEMREFFVYDNYVVNKTKIKTAINTPIKIKELVVFLITV